jgi:hypothetical protein
MEAVEDFKYLEFKLFHWLGDNVMIRMADKDQLAEGLNLSIEANAVLAADNEQTKKYMEDMPVGLRRMDRLKEMAEKGEAAAWKEIKRRGLEDKIQKIDNKYYFPN